MATTDEDGGDDERRLFYVAVTRAKDRLYVTFPLRYYHRKYRLGDQHLYAQLTRFLPQDVLRLFEQRAMRYGMVEPVPEDFDTQDDIRTRIDELWQ